MDNKHNFAQLTYIMEYRCLKILNGLTTKNILLYKYLPSIKTIKEKRIIENYYTKNDLVYKKRNYLYLDKVYKIFNLHRDDIKVPFYWRFKLFINNFF